MFPHLSNIWFKVSYKHYFVFRIFSILFASTWFVPDEYFQSVEVAYNMVYGKGIKTWEWKPNNALRSALHPTMYAIPFWIMKFCGCDSRLLVIWTPHLIQAGLFAVADVFYYRFLQRIPGFKSQAIGVAMLLYLTNWFVLYCSTRTLANTIETALSLVALYWYQSLTNSFGEHKSKEEIKVISKTSLKEARLCALCVSIAVVMRPTSILIWTPLFIIDFFKNPTRWHYLIRCHIPCCLLVLFASIMIDSLYYGKITLSLWNFAKFNILKGGSAHFGTNVWIWYIVNGLPTLFTVLCVPMAALLKRQLRIGNNADAEEPSSSDGFQVQVPSRFFWVSMFYVAFHSAIAHKEHRFMLPIIPFMIPYLVSEIDEIFGGKITELSTYRMKQSFKHLFIWATVTLNVAMALYLGLVHQRGPNVATDFIAKEILQKYSNRTVHIAQLMPCFSMPQYAAFHPYSVKIRMLDCTANLEENREDDMFLDGVVQEESDENRMDEAEQFHDDPLGWLRLNWAEHFQDTNVMVAYEKTYERIKRFVEMKGFRVVHKVFHAHFLTSSNQDYRIVIATKSLV